MASTPSYEFLLRHLRSRRGLYILGAGTSAGASEWAGEVRFGQDFLIGPALEYVRGGSFPVSLPIPSELSRKIVNVARASRYRGFFRTVSSDLALLTSHMKRWCSACPMASPASS
jgi:hypothetical protein